MEAKGEGTGGRNTVTEEAPGWRGFLAEASAISDFNTETAGGREPCGNPNTSLTLVLIFLVRLSTHTHTPLTCSTGNVIKFKLVLINKPRKAVPWLA